MNPHDRTAWNAALRMALDRAASRLDALRTRIRVEAFTAGETKGKIEEIAQCATELVAAASACERFLREIHAAVSPDRPVRRESSGALRLPGH
jgi:hypothetical protein